MNVVNRLTAEELEKVSDLLKATGETQEDLPEDDQSNALVVEDIIDGDKPEGEENEVLDAEAAD